MQLHKQSKALFLAIQGRTRLSNMFAHLGLPLHSSAPGFSFAKFKGKFRAEVLVQVYCEKGSQILNVRVVWPPMEVLAAWPLVLVISICSEFQPNTEKTKEATCYVPYKYKPGCRLGAYYTWSLYLKLLCLQPCSRNWRMKEKKPTMFLQPWHLSFCFPFSKASQ